MSDTEIRRYYDQSYPPSLWGGGGTEPPPTELPSEATGMLSALTGGGFKVTKQGPIGGPWVQPPSRGAVGSLVLNGTDLGQYEYVGATFSGSPVGEWITNVASEVSATQTNMDGVDQAAVYTPLIGQIVTLDWDAPGVVPPNAGSGVLTLYTDQAEIRGDFTGKIPANGIIGPMRVNGVDIGIMRAWHTCQSGTWVGAIGVGVAVWIHTVNNALVSNLDYFTSLAGQTVTVEWE